MTLIFLRIMKSKDKNNFTKSGNFVEYNMPCVSNNDQMVNLIMILWLKCTYFCNFLIQTNLEYILYFLIYKLVFHK